MQEPAAVVRPTRRARPTQAGRSPSPMPATARAAQTRSAPASLTPPTRCIAPPRPKPGWPQQSSKSQGREQPSAPPRARSSAERGRRSLILTPAPLQPNTPPPSIGAMALQQADLSAAPSAAILPSAGNNSTPMKGPPEGGGRSSAAARAQINQPNQQRLRTPR